MKIIHFTSLSVAAFTTSIQLCAAADAIKPTQAEIVMKASFKDRGQAKVDRLNQDETQRLCSQYPEKRPTAVAKRIEALNMKLMKYPAPAVRCFPRARRRRSGGVDPNRHGN